jgi:hypothetical protein
MAAYALLIGTKDGKRSLVIDGNPVEIRRLFKTSDGEGFHTLEVIETGVGRTRKRQFKDSAPVAKKTAKKAAKEAADSEPN